jgi:hypothetical protein
MYPYRTRLQWFIFGRYAHLIEGISRRRGELQDSVLDARLVDLAWWNRVRFVTLILLSLGLIATMGAYIARAIPAWETAQSLIERIAALSGASAGFLTLAYLFLTRLLSQIEADILAILMLKQ